MANAVPVLVREAVPQATVLSAEEVRTILEVAFLTVQIDFTEEPVELDVLNDVNRTMWELIGHPPEPVPIVSPLPLPIDHEERRRRIRELSSQLTSTGARELAYTIAYLFTVIDLQLARVETSLLEDLRRELRIDDTRAAELATATAEAITPGVEA